MTDGEGLTMPAKPMRYVIWSNDAAGWRRDADGAADHVSLLANATRYERGAAIEIVSERQWLARPTDVQANVMLVAPECALAIDGERERA